MGAPVTAEGRFYVECPAGATTVLQQNVGAADNELDWIWIEAGTGTVTLNDGGTALFSWGAGTVERFIPLNIKSRLGAWSLTVTAGQNAFAAGAFS
jgi:hypothetical protein